MLKNVVGLVTGGASGLGRATVERLVKEGARVTLAGIHFTFTYFVQSFTLKPFYFQIFQALMDMKSLRLLAKTANSYPATLQKKQT